MGSYKGWGRWGGWVRGQGTCKRRPPNTEHVKMHILPLPHIWRTSPLRMQVFFTCFLSSEPVRGYFDFFKHTSLEKISILKKKKNASWIPGKQVVQVLNAYVTVLLQDKIFWNDFKNIIICHHLFLYFDRRNSHFKSVGPEINISDRNIFSAKTFYNRWRQNIELSKYNKN